MSLIVIILVFQFVIVRLHTKAGPNIDALAMQMLVVVCAFSV